MKKSTFFVSSGKKALATLAMSMLVCSPSHTAFAKDTSCSTSRLSQTMCDFLQKKLSCCVEGDNFVSKNSCTHVDDLLSRLQHLDRWILDDCTTSKYDDYSWTIDEENEPKQWMPYFSKPVQPNYTDTSRRHIPLQDYEMEYVTNEKETPRNGTTANAFTTEVVSLVNDFRKKEGLSMLKQDDTLAEAAMFKANDMAKNNYFDHHSPKHGSLTNIMKKFNISYSSVGENIAQGQRTPKEVVDAWMKSPGHRQNIMNPNFTHIGVGYVNAYWVQHFICK